MGIQQQSRTGPEIQVCNTHSGPIGGPIGRFSFFWGNLLLRQPGQPYFPSVFLLCHRKLMEAPTSGFTIMEYYPWETTLSMRQLQL